jgi:lipooligosaccharide transport system permease protein
MSNLRVSNSGESNLWESLWGIRCVWLRYFDVYRKSLVYSLVTTFVEPVLYLFAFGYGLGGMVGTLHVGGMEISYRKFVFAGIVAQTLLLQGFFEAAYGSFIRMYYQRIFTAMAMTPITLSEVLWGELIWDAARATFSATVVLFIGCCSGDFNILGAIAMIPIAFLSAFIFAGLGVLTAARSRTIEDISYPQFLLIFPMFLFCAIFFPLQNLPPALQFFAKLLPLTGVVSLTRTLVLGFPYESYSAPVLALWLIGLTLASRKFMAKRLVK